MKRISLSLFLMLIALCPISWAYTQPIIIGDTVSAFSATSITTNVATQNRSRAVWIGTTQSLDFSFDGSTWITFNGCTAGTILPLQVVGVRITSGAANPNAGDVLFLN